MKGAEMTAAKFETPESPVIRFFVSAAPYPGDVFLKKWIPASWGAERVSSDPVYQLGPDRHYSANVVARLTRFSFSGRIVDSTRFGSGLSRLFVRRLESIDGTRAFFCGYAIGKASAHWLFAYRVGESEGYFNLWILPSGRRAAVMIAGMTEHGEGPLPPYEPAADPSKTAPAQG